MSKSDANFNAALGRYHAALEQYQEEAAHIELRALAAQKRGRETVTQVNVKTLEAGTKATCLSRVVADAQLILLDEETCANHPDEATVNNAVTTLEARAAMLQVIRRQLELARKDLDCQLDAMVADAEAAREALHKLCVKP